MSATQPAPNRYAVRLDYYVMALAVVMMLLGLRQWAVIIGIMPGDGTFEAMSTVWKLATMHLAVVDLVASVGLWMRVAWGRVIWIYAVVSEIAFHTVFIGTFGSDLPVVSFHLATFAGFVALTIMARRQPAE